ncbi:site-specific integrase [Vibrio vulnificus]|uniref:tyrosine-type recombinase/integrase n=1 Tax=Vibrio TaxID=662 RepID=UPI00030DD2F1|nr:MULTISPECIES: site-specific integrase [Vibrio]EJV0282709.1 site-specific integrase [Vibrio parahaemolyticus]EKH9206902.1 site-specific integrase [Vibrio parahaemolyticus]RZP98279.1 site-specific integrase [Vibrio vulnificus]
MRNNNQLWTFVHDIEYPSVLRFDHQTGEVISTVDKREGVYQFRWPDGRTCFPVEMYLSDISDTKRVKKSDGGTVGTYATDLTHLVRYCYHEKVQFHELRTADIDELIRQLVADKRSNGRRARSNDTIRQGILPKIVAFLKWLQKEHYPQLNLIGVDTTKVRFQIKLKVVKKTGKNGKGFGETEVFPTKLPRSTPQLKTPISAAVINQLWDSINDTRSEMRLNDRLLKLFDETDQEEHLDYMYHRRRFQLTMLEATGLRPQELVQIEYDDNIELVENNKIKIPTLKREEGRFRIIPIEKGVAIKVLLFMEEHRKKLIDRLKKNGLIADENDVDDYIFLGSENAKQVQPDAAYQEFRRLNIRAGVEVKSCQSMFRHRFITNMVKIHLCSFMDKNPLKNKYNINDHDYSTILRKVAGFTDHKDPKSLFHYIDFAWEELDVFSYAYEVSNLQSRLNAISISVKDLKLKVNSFGLDSDMANQILAGLSDIEEEANLLFDNNSKQ